MAGIGNETRTSILPTIDMNANTPGMFGPDYDFADNLPLPGQVGVRDGGGLNDVVDAVKGAAFYVDMIGFGEPSSFLTRGLPVKPLGVNTFMKTGNTCSNGAEMWTYVPGIPKGDALGERVKAGLRSSGLPGMRGMAPGMLEDIKDALNPMPVVNTVFGSGFPSCRLERQPVGDQDGNIQNPGSKKFYVDNPETVERVGRQSFQSRWVKDKDITQSQWEATPKVFCPDGYPKAYHEKGDCKKKITKRDFTPPREGFTGSVGIPLAIGLGTIATLILLKVGVDAFKGRGR
jgi:hypothetical protein